MKRVALSIALLLVATPAFAQLGALRRGLEGAEKVKKLSDVKISDREERELGQHVSDRILADFGVYQDADVARYVTLVGTVLAQASARPGLDWQFIVLDTDGVNAFAAPGGFVHVTRGLLGLLKDESELAGVLAHEIVHVTEKHTVNSIQKNNLIQFGADEVSTSGGLTQALLTQLGERAYRAVLNNEFDRNDENESDASGVQLANKVGYAPAGLRIVLTRLAERNRNRDEPNGLFASHPTIKDRVAHIDRVIRDKKLTATATVSERYAKHITFEATPIESLAVVDPGVRGLTGGGAEKQADANAEKKDEAKKDEPKKGGGFGLGSLKLSGGKQAQSSQTVASAGARGGWPDRDAVGGQNKTRITVTLGPSDLAEFKKAIA